MLLLLLSLADATPRLIAHRGVHQTFSPNGVDHATCTAARMDPPVHHHLENTIPSIQAAFDAGADAVEVDVHLTRDDRLVLFHDATLECRTNGTGAPEDYTFSELASLDLGYGYTSDQGATYPFRGQGLGLWTTLEEVLSAFPGRAFVVDIKRGAPEDGDRVADVLVSLSEVDRVRHSVYGGRRAVDRVRERLPEVLTFDAGRVKSCMKQYLLSGWRGKLDASCAHLNVIVPINWTWMIWGFPQRFEQRLGTVDSAAVVMGPLVDGITTGLDTPSQLARLPAKFEGWIWTNKIEVIGPLVKQGQ